MGPAAGSGKKSDQYQKLADDYHQLASDDRGNGNDDVARGNAFANAGDWSDAGHWYGEAADDYESSAKNDADGYYYDGLAAFLRGLGL